MQEYFRSNKDQIPTFTPAKKLDLAEVDSYVAMEAVIRDEARRLARADAVITESDFLICHYRLYAYKLSVRVWGKLLVQSQHVYQS